MRLAPHLLLAALAVQPAVAQQRTTLGNRSVVIWKPATSASRSPLVIFSHGFGGCATQSKFLTEALAQHGYFVIAPNHRDAKCGGTGDRSLEPFRKPEAWSDTSFADRRDDIRAILAAMQHDTTYTNHVDFTKLVLAGHSLGGYTAVALGGAWSSWKLPNVKAILALSPYTDPFLVHGTLSGIAAPIMYQSGTLDLGINPSLKKSTGVYDGTPAPKYYIEFRGAGHFAWTNLRADFHATILDYSLAFLDHYVKGVGTTDVLRVKGARVADLRFLER